MNKIDLYLNFVKLREEKFEDELMHHLEFMEKNLMINFRIPPIKIRETLQVFSGTTHSLHWKSFLEGYNKSQEDFLNSDSYILIPWPESQMLMEEDWFKECVLSDDSSYFVPFKRYLEFTNDAELPTTN